MNRTRLLPRLLGLENVRVRNAEFEGDTLVIDVCPTWKRARCSCCGAKIPAYDQRERRWRHLDVAGVRCELRYSIRRVQCPKCGVKVERVPWAEPDGIGVFLIPAGFLTGTSSARRELRERVLRRHHLMSAFRLPSATFPGANLANYDYGTNSCSGTCGHFTQMVWADTRYLGCGVATCTGGGEIWVCNYDPRGNLLGQAPY